MPSASAQENQEPSGLGFRNDKNVSYANNGGVQTSRLDVPDDTDIPPYLRKLREHR